MIDKKKIKEEIGGQKYKLPLGSMNWEVSIIEGSSDYRKVQCSRYNTSSHLIANFYKPMRNYK